MLTFVNYRGEVVNTTPVTQPKKKAECSDAFHKGWRVVGLPPGAVEAAAKEYQKKIYEARSRSKEILDFNPDEWMRKARRKAVRSKPYGLPEAAEQCGVLAKKAGWLRVEVVEISKGGAHE